MINKLATEIHENNKNKGFYEDDKNVGEMLCLIHSEVSEALEADRKWKYSNRETIGLQNMMKRDNETFKEMFKGLVKDTFQDELADIMIRVMDLAAYKEIDLETHILVKMKYNSLREYKHGKKY